MPFLQRLLNKDNIENRQKLKRVLDYESSLKSSGKKKKLEQIKPVNYVSNVDAITWENKILFIYLFIYLMFKFSQLDVFIAGLLLVYLITLS